MIKQFYGCSYLSNTVEDGEAKMNLATLSRGDTTNHICAIINCLFAVEGTLFAGKALANHFRGLR